MKVFDPNKKWWEADFKEETKAIDDFLQKLVGSEIVNSGRGRIYKLSLGQDLIGETAKWAGRPSGTGKSQRRWFIVTLHHMGALGIDLVHNVGWYCRAPVSADDKILNTSGAGDSFRGALMYALVSATDFGTEALARALEFATDVATERCRHFRIDTACKQIQSKFGGKYPIYEGRPLP